MWSEFVLALGLMLVIEGILPFLSPQALRRLMLQMAQVDDRALRTAGLISMVLGVGVLYLTRWLS